MEIWGRNGPTFEALLRDLAVLASRRQRDRGVHVTNWYEKWTLQLSLSATLQMAKALLESLPSAERYVCSNVRGDWLHAGAWSGVADDVSA